MLPVRQKVRPPMSVFPGSECRDGCRHAAAARHAKQARARQRSNTITLSRLQLPPRPVAVSARSKGVPPAIATFFSLPPAKKATNWLSGDQNGNAPPSVPCIGRASPLASGRSQIWNTDWAPATNTTWRPSGEIASCAARPVPPAAGPPKTVFSGGATVNWTRSGASVPERDIRTATTTLAIIAIVASAATSHGTRFDRGAAGTVGARPAW